MGIEVFCQVLGSFCTTSCVVSMNFIAAVAVNRLEYWVGFLVGHIRQYFSLYWAAPERRKQKREKRGGR